MRFFAKLRDILSKIKCSCTSSCIKIQVNHNENNTGIIEENFSNHPVKSSEQQEVTDHTDHSH